MLHIFLSQISKMLTHPLQFYNSLDGTICPVLMQNWSMLSTFFFEFTTFVGLVVVCCFLNHQDLLNAIVAPWI